MEEILNANEDTKGVVVVSKGPYDEQWNNMKLHFHDYYEIYFLTEGYRHFFLNDKTYILKKNDMVLINKNAVHKNMPTKNRPASRFALEFSENMIKFLKYDKTISLMEMFAAKEPIINVPEDLVPKVTQTLEKINAEFTGNNLGRELYIYTLLTELLIIFARLMSQEAVIENSMSPLTYEIIKYLESNYNENIKLEDLVNHFNYSSYHLCKIFKKETGSTIIEHLNGNRIKNAMSLLTTSKKSITQIASACGFNSINHFILTFKKYLQTTPSQYRKSQCPS